MTKQYLKFCTYLLWSLQHDIVVRFIAHLAQVGVSHSSMCVYLVSIRFMFYSDCQRLLNPQLSHCNTPLNEYVHRGICRHPLPTPKPPWCPVTLDILETLWLSQSYALEDRRYDATMLWAAYCVAFFGFLSSPVALERVAHHACSA